MADSFSISQTVWKAMLWLVETESKVLDAYNMCTVQLYQLYSVEKYIWAKQSTYLDRGEIALFTLVSDFLGIFGMGEYK